MARIRSIKPEFFTSPDTAKASVEARLFYIALWCWADDYGVGEANLNSLLGFAFPEEDQRGRKEIQSLCKEVANVYGTVFYTVRGRNYYYIPAWDEHQKTQRRANRRNPLPDDPESVPDQRIYGKQGNSESLQGSSEQLQGESPLGTGEHRNIGTGEQGNIGTGEQGNIGTGEQGNIGTDAQNDVSRVSENFELIPEPAPQKSVNQLFDEFWEVYPRKRDKGKARDPFAAALKRASFEQIMAGARAYREDPNRVEQFTKYAQGWLSGDCWLDEPLPDRSDGKPDTNQKVASVLAAGNRLQQQQQQSQGGNQIGN